MRTLVRYWLLKSEPSAFSITDLARVGIEPWDGVRNYQARNFMRDGMKQGDLGFFYHSSCAEPGIAGILSIAREAYPDDTASTMQNSRWLRVDVAYERTLRRVITLAELKQQPELAEWALVRRGNRLSIMPVTARQWELILALE